MKKLMLSLLLLYGFSMTTVAQPDAYVAYVPPGGGSIKVMLLDVETCTFCNVAELPFVSPNSGQQYRDLVVLPDGRIVIFKSGISNAPIEIFTPPMETGVIYYLAAMAGNNLNGNVDLADPCLDFSNALQVVWQPLPTVTFSAANPNVCIGDCITVTATFTGIAPFTLTYNYPLLAR